MRIDIKRLKILALLGLGAVLLLPATALTQSGMWPGGGGGFPGGGGGFPGGGSGRWNRDPNERFNEYAGGKDVWRRSEITDPNMLQRFDRAAGMVGSTNGEITRQQYVSAMQAMTERFRSGGFTPPPGSPPPSGSPAPPAAPGQPAPPGAPGASNWMDTMIEDRFRKLDQNGDGLLNNDEMPDSLKAERDKWDTNHDGFIDLNEFKAYAQARIQQMQADRGGSGFGGGFNIQGGAGAGSAPENPLDDEDKRPTVYRAGKLPKDLPAWFTEADTDGDGQVGLYEWRAKGWPIEQFQQLDRNNDGFITIDEALRSVKQGGAGVLTASAQASPGGPPSAGGPPMAGAPSGGPGFGRGGPPGGAGGGFPGVGRGGPPGGGSGGSGGGFTPFGGRGGRGGGGRRGGGDRSGG